MIPIFQTRFGSDPPGNCFAACVATILECQLSELPDEMECVKELEVSLEDWNDLPPRARWGHSWSMHWKHMQYHLMKYYGIVMLEVEESSPDFGGVTGVYTIVSTDGPRGLPHCCVVMDKLIVHDPHPSNEGISEKGRTYIYFVQLQPKKFIPAYNCEIVFEKARQMGNSNAIVRQLMKEQF